MRPAHEDRPKNANLPTNEGPSASVDVPITRTLQGACVHRGVLVLFKPFLGVLLVSTVRPGVICYKSKDLLYVDSSDKAVFQIIGTTPIWIGDDLGKLQQPGGKLTRMATWNVGGRTGTLKTEAKLLVVLDMMEKMKIHLLCVCGGKATQTEVSQALCTCGAAESFKAYGYDGPHHRPA